MSVLVADGPCRILMLDDNELDRLLTHTALSRLGDMDCARGGAANFRASRFRGSPDGDLPPPRLICEIERALLAMSSVLDLTEVAA